MYTLKSRNLCVRVSNKMFNQIEIEAEKVNLDKQAVMVVLLTKWLNNEVKI